MARPKSIIADRFEARIARCPMSGCWIWTGTINKDGYGQFAIDGRTLLSHRVAWEFFVGPLPSDLFVLHSCDVRSCVNPSHLFIGTHLDNMADMTKKGRRIGVKSGEKHPLCKISSEIVREIFRLRASGLSVKDIAARFEITSHHTSDILHRRYWSTLER